MKKLFLLLVCAIFMCSCYNTRILVGNVNEKTPAVEVNQITNHHLIYGLVPIGKNRCVELKDYVGNRENYIVKTNTSFINGLLMWITCGIYTPTTTTFYVPLSDINASNK